MEIAIVTGASRGFGAATAEKFLEKGIGLYTLARNENHELKEKAENKHLTYAHFQCDLSSLEGQSQVLDDITREIKKLDGLNQIYVVNNAGIVDPIEVVGRINPDDLERILNLNVLAPMVITNRLVHDFPGTPLFVINVTSGAANRPMHGWSAYGSSKSALNLYTRTAALESEEGGSSHTFIAFNPGVMDTEMQGVIRSTDEDSFKDVGRFRRLKEKGELRKPEEVAYALFSLIFNGNVENGEIYDVSELL